MLSSNLQTLYEQRAGMLVSRPHPDGEVKRVIGITCRRDWRPTAAQTRLVASVKEVVEEIASLR
mgnify:CR=1 FL=1